MHRHQADRVDRIDRGVRFVADRQPIEMLGDAPERRVAAVLDAPHEPAQLLQILPRLEVPRPAKLVASRRSSRESRRAARPASHDPPRQPARDRRAQRAPAPSGLRHPARRTPPARPARPPPSASRGASRLTPSSDSRTRRERRNAAARRSDVGSARNLSSATASWISVGVEEAEALVDVRRDAATLERRLELAMALARPEQDADVRRPGRTPDAGLAIADRRPTTAAGRSRRRPRSAAARTVSRGDESERDVVVGRADRRSADRVAPP